MYIVKEPIDSLIYSSSYNDAYDALLKKLNAMNFHIDKQDKEKGEIVIRCVSSLMNLILWKWWGNKLLFEVREINDSKTRVDIFGIPAFFRTRIKKGEKVIDLDKLVWDLKSLSWELGDDSQKE